MSRKNCKNCLWWWDLYNKGEWKCYRKESPFFHKSTQKECSKYEYPVSNRMNMNIGMGFCKTK